MFDSISSIASRIASIDDRARRLNVAWTTDAVAAGTPATGSPTAGTPASTGTPATGTPEASESASFATAMADTKAATHARRASSAAPSASATAASRHASADRLDAQLDALKGGRPAHHAATAAAAKPAAAPEKAAASKTAATHSTSTTASSAPANAAATPNTPAADTVTPSGTVTAADDATAPVIDPALGAYGYRSAAAWEPSGPVGQLVAKYGINKGTYIDLGSPAAVVGRGATPEEMKILAGSGAFGTPGTYPGLDYSYFTGLEGTTGIDKLADGTPVPAGMAVWSVWKNGQMIHQEIAPPNIDSTQMSMKYLGFA